MVRAYFRTNKPNPPHQKIIKHARTWMNLKVIMLSERSQTTHENICCMTLYGILEKVTILLGEVTNSGGPCGIWWVVKML